MMDLQIWKQRREEMMYEARQNRLAKALRESRKGRGPCPQALEVFKGSRMNRRRKPGE